jgi:23S rRNA (adenine1618-N6)-methyltransferase
MSSTSKEAPNYDEEVDFQALAMIDPDFAKFYDDANGHVDFQDPKALQQDSHHLRQLQTIDTDYNQTTY